MRRATQVSAGRVLAPLFQFTPVMRRATFLFLSRAEAQGFNSRPSCDGRHVLALDVARPEQVSIHARHATGDIRRHSNGTHYNSFNSRPSCDGRRSARHCMSARSCFNSRPSCDGRLSHPPLRRCGALFQFTPVMRRATPTARRTSLRGRFNSRPSCDGRHDG